MNFLQRMKEAGLDVPLEEELLEVGGLIAAWFDEQDEETRRLRYRKAVEALWDVAMSLPVDEWGYLTMDGSTRINQVIGSPGNKP